MSFDRSVHAARLGELVRSSGANLGAMMDPDGEQLTLVDDTGYVLEDDEALLMLTQLVTTAEPGRTDRRARRRQPRGGGDLCRYRLERAADQAVGGPAARGG